MVVIDLMMPGMDGVELARRIKRIADLPIIVVSAVTADDSKISALEDFAEDYVTKPFVYEELAARVHRVLRRAGTGTPQLSIDDGDLIIDLVNRQVSSQGIASSLTRIEVRFLQVLIAAMGRTVSTESILAKVWPDSDGADPSYAWVTVRRLRRKLEADPNHPRYLLTDRGAGYRLEASRSTTLHAR
jgi:two-component system KDP operon response regulator KdpE